MCVAVQVSVCINTSQEHTFYMGSLCFISGEALTINNRQEQKKNEITVNHEGATNRHQHDHLSVFSQQTAECSKVLTTGRGDVNLNSCVPFCPRADQEALHSL